MSYASVLVYVGHDRSNDVRIRIAGQLADKFDAGIIGVAACEASEAAYFATGSHALALFEESRDWLRQDMAQMEERFRHAVQDHARDVTWRCAIGHPTDFVTQEARAADIVVAGANRRGDVIDPLRQLDLGALLMQVGRPVLVVPPQAEWLDMRVVMVAWKDTKQARRAVADALPLLHRADEVKIVEVFEDHDAAAAANERVRDVAAWLARRGIDATALVTDARGDAVGQLDQAATDAGAHIIVAGAYGHGRLREWVLGGVTRHLITDPQRVALLSH